MPDALGTNVWTPRPARVLAELLNARDSPFEAEELRSFGEDRYAVGRKRHIFDDASMEPVYQKAPDVQALFKQVWPSGFDEPASEIQLDLTLEQILARNSMVNELFAYLTVKQVPFLAAVADLDAWRWRLLLAYDPVRPVMMPGIMTLPPIGNIVGAPHTA